jgi:transcriptional regulator PpsR
LVCSIDEHRFTPENQHSFGGIKVKEPLRNSSRFESLQPETVAKLVSATADVAMVVDPGGVVRHVEFGGDRGLAQLLNGLIGRHWIDTVSPDSRAKANDLIEEAAANDDARPREINHPVASERDSVPIRYSAIRLSGSNEIIVVGRDLRNLAALEQRLTLTQQMLERDYSRLRASETRYRLLFAVTSETVIIADASNRRIVETNPAASALFGERARLTSRTVQQLFDASSQDVFLSLLAQAASSSEGGNGRCRLMDGKTDASVNVTLFRQDGASFLLLRIRPEIHTVPGAAPKEPGVDLASALDHLPDGFVMTDAFGDILSANAGFLDFTQLANEQQVAGQSLDRWLGRPGIDQANLRSMLSKDGTVRGFSTVMRGSFGASADVEISAAAIGPKRDTHAFLIRKKSAAPDLETRMKDDLPRSVEQMAELVGSVPMKDLVRQTTDIIERLCIEAALQLTGDNRASAADLLGLSRQSLYAKLHRYGMAFSEVETAD